MATNQPSRDRVAFRPAGLLLLLTGLSAVVAVVATPPELVDIEQIDGLADRYALVAAHDGGYRLTNLLIGVTILLAAAAVTAVTRARPGRTPLGSLERGALAAGAVAAAGLVAEAALRATLVVDRATDLATGRATNGTGLTDRLVAGDGALIFLSVAAMGALAALALAWHRRNVFGRPTAAVLVIAGVAGALLVRSDPFANVFVPFFTFDVGFVVAGIVLLVRGTPLSASQHGAALARPSTQGA